MWDEQLNKGDEDCSFYWSTEDMTMNKIVPYAESTFALFQEIVKLYVQGSRVAIASLTSEGTD